MSEAYWVHRGPAQVDPEVARLAAMAEAMHPKSPLRPTTTTESSHGPQRSNSTEVDRLIALHEKRR